MSQENVELAQQAFDAFNRRDMGAFLALRDAAQSRPRRRQRHSVRGHGLGGCPLA